MRPGALLLVALWLAAGAGSGTAGQKPWGVPARAKARKNPVPASAESIAKGRNLYQNHCLVCHGERGAGDGPWVTRLPEPPRDLTDPAVMSAMSNGELFWKISQGRDLMPGYARTLPVEERWDLVNYLRTLVRAVGRPRR